MTNIPDFLKDYLCTYYNEEYVSKIIDGYSKKRKTTFRINTLKEDIDISNIPCVKIESLKNAFELTDESFKLFDTEYVKNGNIYLQSISSMIPPYVLNPSNNDTLLDMAAAPGSKTSLICALTNNLASICAVEIDKYRSERLKHNLSLLGCKNITVLNIDALKLDDLFSFDKVLLDAPCSGSGTLDLNKENLSISEKLIKNSSVLQKKLLDKAIKLTKPNGYICYSTCSILKCENEEVISSFIKSGKVKIEKISVDNLPLLPSTIDGVLTICPTDKYEGFFIALLKKI